MSRLDVRSSTIPFTRASTAVLRGERRRAPAWWELALGWPLLVMAVLVVSEPVRLQAALQVGVLVWAGRLTLVRSRLAGIHAALLVLGVIVIDVLLSIVAGR